MTPHFIKLLAFAFGFAVFMASSADAKNKAKPPYAAPASSPHCRGANLIRCGPIYNGLDYLGDDPDPFIRLMIQRDLGAKYGGSP
jgi:hypothetical protein